MKLFAVAVITLSMILGCVLPTQAAARETRDIEVTVHLIDIEEIDSVSESFVANFYLEYRWRDPSLTHAGPDSISRNLEEIWYPHMQILNEQQLTDTFPQVAEIRPDGEVIWRQRYWGRLSQPLDLREFPFDSQTLEITLVGMHYGSHALRLHASPSSSIAARLTIPDWRVREWNLAATELPIGLDSTPLPGMVLALHVERYTSYFTLKVLFPLILIVAMSWLVFWIDPSLGSTQISVSITAMLTLIAYRFAIGGMLPMLSFLTSIDYFVLGSTILIFFSLVEVIYTGYLTSRGELERARAVDIKFRWIMPLLFVGVVLETLVLRIGI